MWCFPRYDSIYLVDKHTLRYAIYCYSATNGNIRDAPLYIMAEGISLVGTGVVVGIIFPCA